MDDDDRPLYTVTEFCTHYETKKSDITEAPNINDQYLQYLDALEADDPNITEEDFGILAASLNEEDNEGPRRQGVELALSDLSFSWSSFRPSEISICNKDPKGALTEFPRKVLANRETICYFKAFRSGCQGEALHGLNTNLRLNQLKIEGGLRVPRIIGLVEGEDGSSHMGLLLSYIDCGGITLKRAVNADTPEHLRQRWADQVNSTLKHLHEASIVWGDAKASNVLVDRNMDAWIIDFGGGFTEGWVEREKAGTIEGDMQGLAKIIDYIFGRTKH
ncbi:hypothetical protein VE03_09337 [Pseudogymnoascus sp. 23342-1-I1]|nr:hypothetical protein VE03_09337 [Pseudogymnoascus sp. 23342-1-I1]